MVTEVTGPHRIDGQFRQGIWVIRSLSALTGLAVAGILLAPSAAARSGMSPAVRHGSAALGSYRQGNNEEAGDDIHVTPADYTEADGRTYVPVHCRACGHRREHRRNHKHRQAHRRGPQHHRRACRHLRRRHTYRRGPVGRQRLARELTRAIGLERELRFAHERRLEREYAYELRYEQRLERVRGFQDKLRHELHHGHR